MYSIYVIFTVIRVRVGAHHYLFFEIHIHTEEKRSSQMETKWHGKYMKRNKMIDTKSKRKDLLSEFGEYAHF